MARLIVQIPIPIQKKLKALRAEGITASGLIRSLLTQYFNRPNGQNGDNR
jgi:hypothetical protein